MTVDGYWEAEPIGNGSRWVLTNAFNGMKVECSKAYVRLLEKGEASVSKLIHARLFSVGKPSDFSQWGAYVL